MVNYGNGDNSHYNKFKRQNNYDSNQSGQGGQQHRYNQEGKPYGKRPREEINCDLDFLIRKDRFQQQDKEAPPDQLKRRKFDENQQQPYLKHNAKSDGYNRYKSGPEQPLEFKTPALSEEQASV